MAGKKTSHPNFASAATPPKEQRKNEKGLIENWDSTWADAVYLRTLVENGDVDGLTAGQIQAKFPQFKTFANKTLTGGLKTIRNSFAEEVAQARGPGSNGMLDCCRLLFRLVLFDVVIHFADTNVSLFISTVVQTQSNHANPSAAAAARHFHTAGPSNLFTVAEGVDYEATMADGMSQLGMEEHDDVHTVSSRTTAFRRPSMASRNKNSPEINLAEKIKSTPLRQ